MVDATHRPPGYLVAAWLLVAGVLFAVSAVRYTHGLADTMDFGYQAQMMWKISHGDWYAWSSVFQGPALTGDGALTLYPIAYGFRFLGGPFFLFALQALGVVAASAGLYTIARGEGWTARAATAVALLFCLYPAILGGTEFDYHPDFIALPFLVWAYAYYQQDRRRAYWICLVMAVASKNMAGFAVAGWGLGLILYRRRWADGLAAAGLGLGVLGLELGWLFPHVLPGATLALNASLYGYLGHGFLHIAAGVITHAPAVLAHLIASGPYALWILGPVLGLALVGSAAVPAWGALYVLNAISSNGQQQVVTGQYSVLLAGWLFIAVIEALTRWPAARRRLLVLATAVTGVYELVLLALVIVPMLVLPALPVATATAQLQALAPRTVILTQTHLGSLAYRHPVFGVDRTPAVGYPWLDRLSTLWAEDPGAPTALVFHAPASPYLATLVAAARRAGYQVSAHHAGVVTVRGPRHFTWPRMALAVSGGWQPAAFPWTIPAWTQATAIGQRAWAPPSLVAPRGRSGWLVQPFLAWLTPGRYTLRATTRGDPTGQIVCTPYTHAPTPWWRRALDTTLTFGWSADASRLGPVHMGPLVLSVAHATWMACGVRATGERPWHLTALTVHRVRA